MSMNVFNSLGSNYDLKFVLNSLTSQGNEKDYKNLVVFLEKKYGGRALLTYKGREAIELVLRIIGKPSSVAIAGFTCFVVYKAIENQGYKPFYIDVDKGLNFTPEALQKIIKENSDIKVVIIQNTLGYPCEIEEISSICKKHGIIIVEDLAHSVGTIYKNGKEAGTIGDFVVLSFSQDKMIDAVSGGALIIRNPKFQKGVLRNLQVVDSKTKIIDRLYPLFTYIIRNTYQIGFGRLLHFIFRKINLLSKPIEMKEGKMIHCLPFQYCRFAKTQFDSLESNILHRREIVRIYSEKINKNLLSDKIIQNISFSSNLRFPIFVNNRKSLIQYLKQKGAYVSDIWYDAPIAPKKFLEFTNYRNQCPAAEKISDKILNLPTHINVLEKDARQICHFINQWAKLQ